MRYEERGEDDALGFLQQLGVILVIFGSVLLAGLAGGFGLTVLVKKVLKR